MGARRRRTAAQAAVRAGAAWRLPAALLVLSGAAGLVYQVLWVKQLSLVLGVDVQAVTVGVSAFFAGLALGAGRSVDGQTDWQTALPRPGGFIFGWNAGLLRWRWAPPWRWPMRRRRSRGWKPAPG